VHRDVKPANVLLERGLRPRLADFGIATALDRTATTANGCVIGTAAYLAPEQVRGEQVGPPADVYALGLVLLEALTARREYTGGPVEVAVARLWRPPVVPDGLPADLAALLHAMTRAEPAERPAAAEVAAALAPRRPASTAARHGRHRRRTAPQLTTALLAGAAAVAAVASVASGAAADQRAPERVSGSTDVVQVHRPLR
jgi:eukaryotic-like serine/threonine-protein kinase